MSISWLPKWLTGKTKTIRNSRSDSKKNRRRLELEALEERRLFSVTIVEFGPTQPAPRNAPISNTTTEIAAGPDGALWFTEPNAIGRITPSGQLTEFTTGLPTNSSPFGIAAGPDGNMWFTLQGQSRAIGQITTTPDHTIRVFSPVDSQLRGTPELITAGPDNALWFTEQFSPAIGRITTSGTFQEFTNGLPSNSSPFGIAAGSDGALWFTDHSNGSIGRINATPDHGIAEFSLPSQFAGPDHITSGPDGALWFTEANFNQIGRIDPTSFQITETPVPEAQGHNAIPSGITTGPDNNLWFTEQDNSGGNFPDQIGRLSPTTGNSITLFNIPNTPNPNATPQGITTGPDNALWFTETQKTQVGRVGFSGLTGTGTSITEVQGHQCTDVVANFTDNDTGVTQSNFTVTINWGDGTPLDTTTGTVEQTGTGTTGNTFSVSGTHTYANKGNFTITVTIHDIQDNLNVPVTSTAQVISANEAFVRALYRDVLLRLADAGGLTLWVNALDSGALNRPQVADGFNRSAERRGLEIEQDYECFLGRAADPVGKAGYVRAFLAGASEADIILDIISSPEYTLTHNNTAFVNNLYSCILERTGLAAEVNAWVQVLNSGALSRRDVTIFFLASAECYTKAINQNYLVYLRRGADVGGFGVFFAGILNGTIDSTALSDSILGSEEYFKLNAANCPD
jgi:streptogramin lyase